MVFDVRKRVVGPAVEGVPEYIELDVYIPSHKVGFLYQVLISMIIFLHFLMAINRASNAMQAVHQYTPIEIASERSRPKRKVYP